MEGDFIWLRVLHPRAGMAVPWPDMTRFARHVSPHWVFVFFPPPVGLGRGAQPKTDQGERLSERSEFELDPVFGEYRRLPAAKRRDPDHRVAFLLGTFLWRRKEKCLARRGETRLAGKPHRRGPRSWIPDRVRDDKPGGKGRHQAHALRPQTTLYCVINVATSTDINEAATMTSAM